MICRWGVELLILFFLNSRNIMHTAVKPRIQDNVYIRAYMKACITNIRRAYINRYWRITEYFLSLSLSLRSLCWFILGINIHCYSLYESFKPSYARPWRSTYRCSLIGYIISLLKIDNKSIMWTEYVNCQKNRII